MAKQINVGVGGAVKKVSKVPICIGGVVKQAKKGVAGVGGAVKEFFSSGYDLYSYGSNPAGFYFQSYNSGSVFNSDHILVNGGFCTFRGTMKTNVLSKYTKFCIELDVTQILSKWNRPALLIYCNYEGAEHMLPAISTGRHTLSWYIDDTDWSTDDSNIYWYITMLADDYSYTSANKNFFKIYRVWLEE